MGSEVIPSILSIPIIGLYQLLSFALVNKLVIKLVINNLLIDYQADYQLVIDSDRFLNSFP
jgi:hypothetical protein